MKPGGRSESRRRQESTLVLSLGSRSIQLGPPAREEVMHCPLEKTCVHILTRSSTAISDDWRVAQEAESKHVDMPTDNFPDNPNLGGDNNCCRGITVL